MGSASEKQTGHTSTLCTCLQSIRSGYWLKKLHTTQLEDKNNKLNNISLAGTYLEFSVLLGTSSLQGRALSEDAESIDSTEK